MDFDPRLNNGYYQAPSHQPDQQQHPTAQGVGNAPADTSGGWPQPQHASAPWNPNQAYVPYGAPPPPSYELGDAWNAPPAPSYDYSQPPPLTNFNDGHFHPIAPHNFDQHFSGPQPQFTGNNFGEAVQGSNYGFEQPPQEATYGNNPGASYGYNPDPSYPPNPGFDYNQSHLGAGYGCSPAPSYAPAQYAGAAMQYGNLGHFDVTGVQAVQGPARSEFYAEVLQRIQKNIAIKNLHRFYPDGGLAVADIASRVDYRALATKHNLNLEVALDLATLALYDVKCYGDDSGSMAGSHWKGLQQTFELAVDIAHRFDTDGIEAAFMHHKQVCKARTPDDLKAFIASIKGFGGSTPLAGQLRHKVLVPIIEQVKAGTLKKPVNIVIITDGEPTGEPRELTEQIIQEMKELLERHGYPHTAVAFQFAQIGNDKQAWDYLSKIDRRDNVDQTGNYQYEKAQCEKVNVTLTYELYLIKLLLGAVDPDYDLRDEPPTGAPPNYPAGEASSSAPVPQAGHWQQPQGYVQSAEWYDVMK